MDVKSIERLRAKGGAKQLIVIKYGLFNESIESYHDVTATTIYT